MIVAPPHYKPVAARLDLKATKKSGIVYECNVLFSLSLSKIYGDRIKVVWYGPT